MIINNNTKNNNLFNKEETAHDFEMTNNFK